jgi:sugar phosphate isomerase/epimerase
MNISVCLEGFRQKDGRMDMFSAIKKAAAMGFEGVEFFGGVHEVFGFGLPQLSGLRRRPRPRRRPES